MALTRISLAVIAAVAGISSAAAAETGSRVRHGTGAVLQLTRASYAGVRCAGGNSIACDRISLAVWPAGHPQRLTATIAGRRIALRPPPPGSGRDDWEGTLNHAGLLTRGPLFVTPDRGRFWWAGRHPRSFTLRLSARSRARGDAQARERVVLHPGWG